MDRLRALILPLIVVLGWPSGVVLAAGPEIFSLSPDQGPADKPILLRGKHLEGTRRVFFSAGCVVKTARFKVLTDREIEVIAPDFFLEGTEATVAVLTDQGITVGMPPDAETIDADSPSTAGSAPFSLVKRGGVIGYVQGISMVEDGGVVQGSTTLVGMHFVQKGGILLGFSNAEGVVFEEPGATLGPAFFNNTRPLPEQEVTRVHVPHISVSRGIPRFRFETPEQAPGPLESAPKIERIEPTVAKYGAVLDVRGTGFLGTTAVYFSTNLSPPLSPAGFRVVSDRHLKVEVPSANGAGIPRRQMDLLHRNKQWKWPFAPVKPQFVIVVNPKGVTVTVPAAPSGQPLREVYDLFEYVGAGQSSTRDHQVSLVGPDGLATNNSGVLFLKNGARLATSVGYDVFFEPQVELPASRNNAKKYHRVESINVSPLRTMLVTIAPVF